MNFFFGSAFWGILLILWGASLILKTFNVNIPLARIFLAVIIIVFGVKLLIGAGGKTAKRTGSGKRSYISTNKSGEYTLIFSSGTIDLSDLDENSRDVEITVIFGSAEVILPSHLAYDIDPTTVFGQTNLPGRNQFGFGGPRYHAGDDNLKPINIESNCIFGGMKYIFADVETPSNSDTEQTADNEEGGSSF